MPDIETSAAPLGMGALSPWSDVEAGARGFVALSGEPWLRLNDRLLPRSGRWCRIVYRASFLDRLTRPTLRLLLADGTVEDIHMAGPFLGRGAWRFHAPDGLRGALVRPVDRPGPFGFEIEAFEPLSLAAVLVGGLMADPERTAAASIAWLRRMRVETFDHMACAIGPRPLRDYDAFRRERLRAFDPEGLDRPRLDWSAAPHVRFAVRVGQSDMAALERLVERLGQQPFPYWSVAAVADTPDKGLRNRLEVVLPPGSRVVAEAEGADALAAGLAGDALIGRCGVEDLIPDYALPVLVEQAAASAASVFYGDEDRIEASGRHAAPRLKPDWSPQLDAQTGYSGAPVFVRASALAGASLTARAFADPDAAIASRLAARGASPEHVRRVLLTRRGGSASASSAPAAPRAMTAPPLASIIIPTRDRAHLLQACVSSIFARSGAHPYEVIVVDNGSAEDRTLRYLAELERDPRVRILRRPIPFNFSRLCNDGAAIASGAALIFLNNDTAVVSSDWLAPLTGLATRPEIGAVGPKLLFKSGRVQHAGVVVGLMGRADHLFGRARNGDPGYLGMLGATREVSAVTGACLAVERGKFDAVGGFDADNLPIDLNDIDLCLRLRERGLVNLYTPDSTLYHYESATRGVFAQPSRVYAKERAYFVARWGEVIRDDPMFHPGLSQWSLAPALA